MAAQAHALYGDPTANIAAGAAGGSASASSLSIAAMKSVIRAAGFPVNHLVARRDVVANYEQAIAHLERRAAEAMEHAGSFRRATATDHSSATDNLERQFDAQLKSALIEEFGANFSYVSTLEEFLERMGLTPDTRERFPCRAGRVTMCATNGDADVNQFAASFVRDSFNLTGDQDGKAFGWVGRRVEDGILLEAPRAVSVGVSLLATAMVGALESLDISVSSDFFGRGAPGFGQVAMLEAVSSLLSNYCDSTPPGFDDVMSIIGVTDRRVIMAIFVAVWLNLNAPADDYRPVLEVLSGSRSVPEATRCRAHMCRSQPARARALDRSRDRTG